MTNHGQKTPWEHQRRLRWSLGTIADGHAGSVRRRGARPERHERRHREGRNTRRRWRAGDTLTYDVKASGDTSLFCDAYQTGTGVCTVVAGIDNAHTVTYTVETTWLSYPDEYDRPHRMVQSRDRWSDQRAHVEDSGRPPGVTTSIGPGAKCPIPPTEERPLLATMTLVSSEANIGTNKTLQWAVNPQISVENDEATEGTDTHLIFNVTLLPPALETTTADYGTQGASATGGGVDFTDTNGTLTWTAGAEHQEGPGPDRRRQRPPTAERKCSSS